MRKSVKTAIATVLTAVVTVAGYGVYNLATALTGRSGRSGGAAAAGARPAVTGPPTAEQAAGAARAFLAAWAGGDLSGAAAATDDPAAATTALTAFQRQVGPSAIHLTAGGPAAGPDPSAPGSIPSAAPSAPSAPSAAPATDTALSLPFSASVEFAGTGTPWTYDGVLGLVRTRDGRTVVHWTPHVIHPHLDAGESIAVRPVAGTPAGITDRNGKPLTGFPSLAGSLEQFTALVPQGGTADDGSAVLITKDSDGTAEKLFTVTEPRPIPALKLTLDARLQEAAEAAVAKQSAGGTRAASLVAIEPSTGHVLAYAFSPSTGPNRAFTGITPPGSTMKVVTAAALLEAGVTPSTPVPCPATTLVTGLPVANDFADARPGNTFADDFAQSCNTAFLEKGREVLKPDSLPNTAKEVFGLGLEWRTGLTDFDTRIPTESNMAAAAPEFIGQGRVQTNPLAMASVAATVQSGTFRMPILLPGLPQQPAARRLSKGVLNDLRALMTRTAQSGTAAGPMAGIPGAAAKTGTAEVGGGKPANSWFTAYRGDLAVAAEVEGGLHGAQSAGPAVAELLRIGNG
ncbi:penicillin-binding transpeptidase domain-containing protein [Kitasatospora sp. NPDC088783]|uniref:penicillin-binding transpeptidase domain-containing protein n=1 Tax=Kitasatospora sp. NPDC088783 TaxID=3364077 RepID=UPI003818E6A1